MRKTEIKRWRWEKSEMKKESDSARGGKREMEKGRDGEKEK